MDKVEQYTEELYGYGVGRRKEEATKKKGRIKDVATLCRNLDVAGFLLAV